MIALYFLLSTGLIAFGLLSLRRRAWAAPGRLIALLVLFYGLVVKPLFVALALPSEEFIAAFILSPLTEPEYWSGSVVVLGAYALFIFAMCFTAILLPRFRRPPPPSAPVIFSVPRAWVLTLVGMAAFVVFISQNVELLYGANKNILATEDLAEYRGGGFVRLLASVLFFVPFLMLVNLRFGYRVRGSGVLFWTSAIAWTAFGFFSDQRGTILFSALSWLIAYHLFVRPIRLKQLLTVVGIAFVMVLARTILRVAADDAGLLETANEVIGNYIGGNLVENAKTLIVIQSIPQQLPYTFGGTYVDSVAILLPRSIFPDKQTVNLDTIIGMSVFGCEFFGACAVPPGLVAESYLNFDVIGVLAMMVVCGALTAWFDWKSARSSVQFRILYAAGLVYFGMSVLGSSVASFTTHIITYAIVLLLSYHATRHAARAGLWHRSRLMRAAY